MCSIRTLFRKRMKLLGYLIRQLHNPKRLRAWKLHFLKGRREFFRKEFLVFVGIAYFIVSDFNSNRLPWTPHVLEFCIIRAHYIFARNVLRFRRLDFDEIGALRAKYKGVQQIAPMPDASITHPHIIIKPSPAAAAPLAAEGFIANPKEVQ